MTRYIINSAVITAFGSYDYIPLTVDQAREWIAAGPFVSTIGYQNTADWIKARLGVEVPLSREARQMQPGDEALVVRLKYRLDSPALKAGGGVELRDEDVELGLLRRLS